MPEQTTGALKERLGGLGIHVVRQPPDLLNDFIRHEVRGLSNRLQQANNALKRQTQRARINGQLQQ